MDNKKNKWLPLSIQTNQGKISLKPMGTVKSAGSSKKPKTVNKLNMDDKINKSLPLSIQTNQGKISSKPMSTVKSASSSKKPKSTQKRPSRTQPGGCCCCLSKGKFMSMSSKHNGCLINYSEMLQCTLGVNLSINCSKLFICSLCSVKLRQAYNFRKQILEAHKIFIGRDKDDDLIEVVSDGETEQYLWGKKSIGINTDPIPSTSILEGNVSLEPVADDAPFVDDDHFVEDVEESESDDDTDYDFDTPLNTIPQAKSRNTDNNSQGATAAKTTLDVPNKVIDSQIAHEARKTKDPKMCYICPMEFKSYNERKSHTRKVHGSKCHYCKEYVPFDLLKHHKIKVHGAEAYPCNICGTLFLTKGHLEKHRLCIHVKEVCYVTCDVCGFKCIKKYLYNHMKGHREKVLQCKFCSKRFARSGTLAMHERIHKGEKNKVCELCGDAFVQRASLKYHMEKRHPNGEVKDK